MDTFEYKLLTADGDEEDAFKTRAWIVVLFQELKDGRKYPTVDIERSEYKYLIIGDEVCPKSGRKHWQGYVEFKSARTRKGVKRAFGRNDMFCAARKGTAAQAAKYCMKEGAFQEFGEISQQGRRSDLDKLCGELVNGTRTVSQMLMSEDAPLVCKYRNGLRDIQHVVDGTKYCNIRDIEVVEYTCYDWTMIQKLKDLREKFPDAFIVNQLHPLDTVKWDYYQNETELIVCIRKPMCETSQQGVYRNRLWDQITSCTATQLDVKFGTKVAMWTKVHKVVVYANSISPEELLSSVNWTRS